MLQPRAGQRWQGSPAGTAADGAPRAPAMAAAFALPSPAPQMGGQRGGAEGAAEAPRRARGARGPALRPGKAALPPADWRLIEDCH